MSDDVVIVAHEDWDQHPWLSRLDSASGTQGDRAWFFCNDDLPAPIELLSQIVIEQRADDGDWTPALRADGERFPSRDWEQAAVGWYEPIWAFMNSERRWQFRALIPAHIAPTT